jgi:hypothetical protein
MELTEYYSELTAYLKSLDQEPASAYLEYCGVLLDGLGIFDDLNVVNFKDTRNLRRQMAISAYSLHMGSGTLHLLVVDFQDNTSLGTIGKAEFQRQFALLENFLAAAMANDYANYFRAGTPQGDLADELQCLWGTQAVNLPEAQRIQFHLLTNCRLNTHERALPEHEINSIPVSYEIWDIQRLFRIEQSGQAREDIRIDFTEFEEGGLAALPASHPEGAPNAFLFAMPGPLLAKIYSKYGDRLLEQNVRTFLQFRGNVNRGLRNTIQNEPQVFFTYNNGLTTTAEAADFDAKSGRLKGVTNFQIVNGGQTTAAIFAARMLKHDISKVFVQVKLSVVEPEQCDYLIPRISEYANTQNKVSAADLSSNHPFQRRIEELSRRLTTHTSGNLTGETHWFYERTRGQYMNAQLKMSPAQKKRFLEENPRTQVFTKTDLAKYEFSFAGKPHVASLGAQKCFVRFVEDIAKRWEREDLSFNDFYFKQVIGRAIIFRALDKRIHKEAWYDGYKANIVAYTLAVFARVVESTRKTFDYARIWSGNSAPDELIDFISAIAADVNRLIKAPQDVTSNIGEYCKREACWNRIQVLDANFPLPHSLQAYLLNAVDQERAQRDAAGFQQVANGVAPVIDVLQRGTPYWQHFQAWTCEHPCLSPFESNALRSAAMGRPLQDRQAAALLKGLNRAEGMGYLPRTVA